jgi:hypothetical protein
VPETGETEREDMILVYVKCPKNRKINREKLRRNFTNYVIRVKRRNCINYRN